MTTEPARKPASSRAAKPCAHHWVLSEPAENHVPGRCKHCGEEREFPGTPDGTKRFDDFQELTSTRAYYREATAG